MTTVDITGIVQIIVQLVVAAVLTFVVPYIKKKLSTEQLNEALIWVDIAVAAAEQIYNSTQGAEKKAYVIDFIESKGFKIDASELDKAIEAAVLELHDSLYGTTKIEQATEE